MVEIVDVKPRTRAGSYDTFERRYGSISLPDDSIMREFPDPEVAKADERQVWTVLDCDGTLYLSPGKQFVNRMGYVLTERGWSDTEYSNPGYVY
jgi:hypothetical protein